MTNNYKVLWEDRIRVFREKKRLLLLKNIHFKAPRAEVEGAIRAKLTNPDSATLLWPPSNNPRYTNPKRHMGWMMIGFNDRPEARSALEQLNTLNVRGRRVNITKASKEAFVPVNHSTAPATTSLTSRASRMPPPTTTVPATPAPVIAYAASTPAAESPTPTSTTATAATAGATAVTPAVQNTPADASPDLDTSNKGDSMPPQKASSKTWPGTAAPPARVDEDFEIDYSESE